MIGGSNRMQRKNYKAYFTVEAAVLYPIVLGVIVLMTYLLFFNMIAAFWNRIWEGRQ